MQKEDVAKTVAGTLAFAARQASSPLFEDIIHGPRRDEVTLTVALPGLPRFRLRIEQIEEAADG
jgi:hypothetical protein